MYYKLLLFIFFILIPNLLFAMPIHTQKIENYLNSITTFSADFKQFDSEGKIKEGRFLLSKPGKMKWEYLKPKRALIISTGTNMVYYDYELEEASYISTESVLAHFLSKEKINLSNDVKIKNISFDNNYYNLIVSYNDENEEKFGISELTLKFERQEDNDIKLIEINVTDESGREIDIMLSNIKTNIKINKSEFIFKNPNFFKGS